MTTSQTNTNDRAAALAAALEQARHTLGLRDFDERKNDRLDFYEQHVTTLLDAVTAAFEAGFAAGAESKIAPRTRSTTMRITKIEVQGQAGHSAILTRVWTSTTIGVEVLLPGSTKRHAVAADDRDGQWSMAEGLQQTLDSRSGPPSEVRGYFDAICQLAD